MPDHDLEPPRFSRRALERLLNDWNAVKSTILTGYKGVDPSSLKSNYGYMYDDQTYLGLQNGTALLDKFTHCLLIKCSREVSVARSTFFGNKRLKFRFRNSV